MKKINCILTKNGQIHMSQVIGHALLIEQFKVRGEDSVDWVRVMVGKNGSYSTSTATVKDLEGIPEWLERQYGWWMDKVMCEARKRGLVK